MGKFSEEPGHRDGAAVQNLSKYYKVFLRPGWLIGCLSQSSPIPEKRSERIKIFYVEEFKGF